MPEGLRGDCRTAFLQSGSGAVETALKFARHHTGRSQIIAFHGAYHGVWMGSGSLTTGYVYRHGWGPMMPGAIHLPYGYCYRCAYNMTYPACDMQCAKFVDYVLNTPYTAADDVAAIIVESQQGEGGYVAPPPEFFQIIKKAAEKYGALYIDDEVQSGAGRTGRMWAIEHTGVVPDILTWGKGMGGDIPMAAVTFSSEINISLVEGSQPGTFAGNALGCSVCMTNIDLITDKNMDLLSRASVLGDELRGILEDATKMINTIGDIRGRGHLRRGRARLRGGQRHGRYGGGANPGRRESGSRKRSPPLDPGPEHQHRIRHVGRPTGQWAVDLRTRRNAGSCRRGSASAR